MDQGPCEATCCWHPRRRRTRVLHSSFFTILMLFMLSNLCTGQLQCSEQEAGCFPPVGNLAIGRTISASSTCEFNSTFCISGPGNGCSFCEPNVTHSSLNINDNSNGTVWISEIGSDNVTLQIDFEAPVLFERMTMVWASPRPESMVLERSNDNGQSWLAYRYYSASCNSFFMLEDVLFETNFSNTEPRCSSTQSNFSPTTGGVVTFATSEHITPDTSAEAATDYKLITNLRVRFLRQFPILSGPEFQYYAVSEWIIEGTCMCNGHASVCAPVPEEQDNASKEVYAGCDCQHHTDGIHCERCDTGFNGMLWTPGTPTEANACEECMCLSHAADCEYNNTLMAAVCINCTDNTSGNECNECLPGFYQNMFVLLDDPNICIACDCNSSGSVDAVVCDDQGQCICKDNVRSLKCDVCIDGYWNLSAENPLGCQECDCNIDGTQTGTNDLALCDQDTGQCVCKENVEGRRCDSCVDGFHSLNLGCQPCDCNLAGSESQVCDQDSPGAQCPCRPNIDSTRCTSPIPGYYFKFLDDIRFEAEEADNLQGTEVVFVLPDEFDTFTGRGFVSFHPFERATFTVTVPQDSQYEFIMRYQAMGIIDVLMTIRAIGNATLDFNCRSESNSVPRINAEFLLPFETFTVVDTLCLSNATQYEITVEYSGFEEWLLDSFVFLPDFSSFSEFYASQSPILVESCLPRAASTSSDILCEEISFGLSVEFYGLVFACDCNVTGSVAVDPSNCDRFGGVCECQEGVGGRECNYCLNGWFNFSTNGCQACSCNVTGSTSSVCDFESGQCDCNPGIGTRTCSECLPGFFSFSSGGCSLCDCSIYSLSNECDDLGQCQCPVGVGGLKCDQCLEEYYNISSAGCLPCECNQLSTLSNICDPTTGQCDCTDNALGRDCNQCPDGFFMTDGTDRDLCVECQCAGKTDVCDIDSGTFVLGAVQSDFTELCAQTPLNCSDGWELRTASGQQAAPYGPSDASGLGYILLDNNHPQLHAPNKFLGDQLAVYGLNFTVALSISNAGRLNMNSNFIRLSGSFLNETLVTTFPEPELVQNGITSNTFLVYSVPFTDVYWQVGTPTGPTTTSFQLVSVLANVTELSFTAEFTEDLIEFVQVRSISLNVAIPIADLGMSPDTVNITSPFPVEDCTCPESFSGQSCQQCAQGYFRPSGNPADVCIRCDCNDLSFDCDVRTGDCINCTGNSEGSKCEMCRSGYYGDPTQGIPCLPCECPTSTNSFSPTCSLNSATNGSVCDNCAMGYTGEHCEFCMDGFFGNPIIGNCITCECYGNVDPSLGPVCDMMSGRCLNCLNNTMGFECNLCVPGYFGDPTLNIPCRSCQCNPNGTDGDCDPLTGMCTCLPDVTGDLCDQCEPGFWGLSQGPGCSPCDCCNNGSTTNTCDQDTGRCSCLSNVGDEDDDKCCMCTHGFFNFSPLTGCEACNCSALSVTEECDQLSGQCECQEGAVGLKCDDCAFGYFGKVPDCERCHECFHQWYDTISGIAGQVDTLQATVDTLIITNYNGYTVSSIEATIASLVQQLEEANHTLSTITLQASDVIMLEDMLTELNGTLTTITELVIEIEQQLATAANMIDTADAFDGSVNGTSAQDIRNLILFYNSTTTLLASNSNNYLLALTQDQAQVHDAWTEASDLSRVVATLLANISYYTNNTEHAAALVNQFQADFDSLRFNLTYLDMKATSLMGNIQTLSIAAANASGDIRSINASVEIFSIEVEHRKGQAVVTLELARELNESVETALLAAQLALESATTLMNISEIAVHSAEDLLQDINLGIMDADSILLNLTVAKDLALAVLNMSLPPLASAEDLARQINRSIIPDDIVQDIVDNATASRMIAEEALAMAQAASAAISNARDLILQVQSDLNCTSVTLSEVEETINRVQDMLVQTEQDLQQISDSSAVVDDTVQEAVTAYDEAIGIIQEANETGQENHQRALSLHEQATQDALLSQWYEEGVEEVQTNYSSVQEQVSTNYEEATSTQQTAVELQSQAEGVNETAHAVPLSQLYDLLNLYAAESNAVENLLTDIDRLQAELQDLDLEAMFTNAAERLRECYKTP